MLLIFCAEIEEAKNIKCKNAKIFITGVGLANVLNTPKLILSPDDTIINIGYAGSNKYEVGSIISINEAKKFKASKTIKEPNIKLKTFNIGFKDFCYTSDSFCEYTLTEIPTIDMELYYLSLIYPNIQAIKIISDDLNYTGYKKFEAKKSWDIVNEFLNNEFYPKS